MLCIHFYNMFILQQLLPQINYAKQFNIIQSANWT